MTVAVDKDEVRRFIEVISAHVVKLAAGLANPGVLQLSRLNCRDDKLVPTRFRIDDVEGMVHRAIGDAEAGFNVYIEPRTVRPDLKGCARGGLDDTVFVFALVVDADHDKGKGGVVAAEPSIATETSPGNGHGWYLFDRRVAARRGKTIGDSMRVATGTDHDTGTVTQPYRVPGTPNFPSKKKQARGRTTVEPTRLVAFGPLWEPDALLEAHKAPAAAGGGATAPQGGAQPGGTGTPCDDVDIDASGFPDDLREIIRDGVPDCEDRSVAFFKVVKALKDEGYIVEQIFRCFSRHPNGIARKYSGRGDLRQRIKSAYDRKTVRRPVSVGAAAIDFTNFADAGGPIPGSRPPRPPPPPPPPPPGSASAQPSGGSALPQPLIEARATFRKWLGEKYDTDILDIVASAGAAERLGGDPLWLMVISGSGNAKTETVRSLEGAGALTASTISSEGALLAATARSRGATGGLLHKIGPRGLLAIKDFTSILAMDSKVRGTVLAALREVHDGKWERHVGYAGGRTLTWRGRIVIVAACTTAWDEARKAIESLGDRFVLARADSTTGRLEAALQAIENTGREAAMRAELAQVMGALIASADLGVRQLDDSERERLIKLANVVTWTRSGVERDYRGDVINAHAPEMPTRFAKQLAQVMRGALSIGIPTDEAMRLATRSARDSLEPLRRDLLLDVAANPGSNPDEVHRRTSKPLTTTKNTLVAMHTLGLLTCVEREERRGGRMVVVPYYWLAPELDRAVLLSM
jgi:hypothetical protein